MILTQGGQHFSAQFVNAMFLVTYHVVNHMLSDLLYIVVGELVNWVFVVCNNKICLFLTFLINCLGIHLSKTRLLLTFTLVLEHSNRYKII
jgi:hypothetical protein